MFRSQRLACWALLFIASCLSFVSGCGTTRTSNTGRTATEQLLISDAIDRTVQSINFSKLSGQTVFFDERHLRSAVDQGYLISSMRQHLLASGCILKENREEAIYVVEPRAGAVGTDNDELLFGIPAANLPQFAMIPGVPSTVPEIPFIKRQHQRGIAKIAVFAYRRETGEPVWQSGIATNESSAKDFWVLGAGPFKKGTIHEGTSYADKKQYLPGIDLVLPEKKQVVGLGQEAVFAEELNPPTEPQNPIPYLAKTPETAGNSPSESSADPSAASNGPAILPPPAKSE